MRELTLAGILMYKDMELAKFDIRKGQTEEFAVLAEDKWYFPFEMLKYQNGSTLSTTPLRLSVSRMVAQRRIAIGLSLRMAHRVGKNFGRKSVTQLGIEPEEALPLCIKLEYANWGQSVIAKLS